MVEVYVDDIVVKIKSRASLLDNFALVFDRLHTTHTKLNPDKCVFRVTAGKLLGFLVSYQGVKANLEKIKTIKAMRPLIHIKDVQEFTRCLAAPSRFISRLAERALPFIKLLRKFGPFVWTEEAEEAFQELKWYLTSSPIMVAPKPDEPLLLYTVATTDAVSMVLVTERLNPKAEEAPGSQPRSLVTGPTPSLSAIPQKPIRVLTTKRSLGPSSRGPPWILGARSPWSLDRWR
jgi:hypothetical protein